MGLISHGALHTTICSVNATKPPMPLPAPAAAQRWCLGGSWTRASSAATGPPGKWALACRLLQTCSLLLPLRKSWLFHACPLLLPQSPVMSTPAVHSTAPHSLAVCRPLSAAQRAYAAVDAYALVTLFWDLLQNQQQQLRQQQPPRGALPLKPLGPAWMVYMAGEAKLVGRWQCGSNCSCLPRWLGCLTAPSAV